MKNMIKKSTMLISLIFAVLLLVFCCFGCTKDQSLLKALNESIIFYL